MIKLFYDTYDFDFIFKYNNYTYNYIYYIKNYYIIYIWLLSHYKKKNLKIAIIIL